MKRLLHVKNRPVLLLTLAAIGAVAFTCISGFVVYSSMQRLISSRDWVEHSEQVLSLLQSATQRLDRIESGVRIYALTASQDNLASARTASVVLRTNAIDITRLTVDNPSQERHAGDLTTCANNLYGILAAMDSATRPPVSGQLLDCRQSVSVMQSEERGLLTQRGDESRSRSFHSFVAGIVFIGFSLLVVIVLFGMLVRDALRRQSIAQQLGDANRQLAANIQSLERRARTSLILGHARDELQLCVSVAQAYASAARYCGKLLPGSLGGLWIINNSRDVAELTAVWGGAHASIDDFSLEACCGLRSGRARWRTAGASEVHCKHFCGVAPESYVCIPLAAHGDTLGVLCVECPSDDILSYARDHIEPLHELVELTAMAVAGLQLRLRLENQSIRDSLTTLFNRHFMEIALERELRRAARQNSSAALLMLDIDHFKQFNDTYGHEAGDQVLREVAQVTLGAVRSEDLVCRYGGEEFVIILPEISRDAAAQRAEALRQLVSEIRLRYRGDILREVTISIGLAMFPQHGETPEQMLRVADRALYQAKHGGRNLVVVCDSPTQIIGAPIFS